MAQLNATTLLVGLVLLYLSTFVFFAIIRITTGISIQRVGYFSLRRITWVPREGVQVDIRGLGLSFHRPHFAQPTWVSLKLTELRITVDPCALGGAATNTADKDESAKLQQHVGKEKVTGRKDGAPTKGTAKPARSQMWKKLTAIKDKIKRSHRRINWLAMADMIAVNTSIHILEVGQVQIGNFNVAVDTRRTMVDRGKLFRRSKRSGEKEAEWIISVRNVLLGVDGQEPEEVLDFLRLNIHGILYRDREGLRDASIAFKLGRLHVPCDDLQTISQRYRLLSGAFTNKDGQGHEEEEISLEAVVDEIEHPGSREEKIVQTVADSREIFGSVLRGIQEFELALSFLRVSYGIESLRLQQRPLKVNVVTHEVGVDLHRLDSKTPAHRMYFSRDDIAHQALIAAISLSVSLDDGINSPAKIFYMPMATTTVKTTLPSKTVTFTEQNSSSDRNSNILFANMVITSPALDLEPNQLSQIIGILQLRREQSAVRKSKRDNRHLIRRLLPKASIKMSVHEPVIRFVLPHNTGGEKQSDDYDLIISAISSISLDIESSHLHASEEALHYSIAATYRVSSHQFYYQTAAGEKHDLLTTEAMELKAQLTSTPDVYVVASGNWRTCCIHMDKKEVSQGIRQIATQFQNHVKPDKLAEPIQAHPPSFLRRLPDWLLHFQFEGSDFSVELAGIDEGLPHLKSTRGVALQLGSWSTEYKANKNESLIRGASRRRATSTALRGDEPMFKVPPTSPKGRGHEHLNGRRMAVHVRGLEGFVIESDNVWEEQSFLSVPRFEVAFSTSSDAHGPVFHINSAIRTIYCQYSLYRHYAIGIALCELREAFAHRSPPEGRSQGAPKGASRFGSFTAQPMDRHRTTELMTVDVKIAMLQLKAVMPQKPTLMLQAYGITAGRHRWSAPFFRTTLLRLNSESPTLKRVWVRIASMNNVRVDVRESKRKSGTKIVDEKSIDVCTDFVRLAVPYQLTMHRIFDNIANTIKAMQQLHHRFKTKSNEYILEKPPEGPKKVPRISLRSKALLFELEDDPFEWKLGTIYRVGLLEQKQRMAREEAYRLKIKKLDEAQQIRRANSRRRNQSAAPRKSEDVERSDSTEGRRRWRSASRGRSSRKMRYDTEGVCEMSETSRISQKAAWIKLQKFNARSWKKRIDAMVRTQTTAIKEIRSLFTGADEPPEEFEDLEQIRSVPNRPGLLSALISDLHLIIDKPSFPIDEYPKFLHKIGKGMPMDMQYALLIPMHIQLNMGEARATLRDYPLDLLHIPAIEAGQSPRLPSWSLKTDFVIAEEYRDSESARHANVDIIPPKWGPDGIEQKGFSILVRRTVAPVKTYSDVTVEINTSLPTRISWGTSYQPVIQDMMMIIEGFTKPEIDPSDRVGFWDKIRMSFHSRINVMWKGGGDVHLGLKGSRDPYVVTGFGAGFVMCWRKNVHWAIHACDDPKKFMTVTSGQFVLAVPDYNHQAHRSAEAMARSGLENDDASTSMASSHLQRHSADFKKVIMKLDGPDQGVQWIAGLMFERNLDDDGGRSFDFRPHYDIVLKNPKYANSIENGEYDAFRGFRSHHIHLSLAVVAPLNREWSVNNSQPSSDCYNTVHLSPRFFTHFFNWWSLFSGVMSLPIRQGSLWPGLEKSSKKFGRHLGTIKYNLLLAPLFIAHIYKHKDAEDYDEKVVSATGLKLRLDSFMLDLHQRREQFQTQVKGRLKQTKATAMKIYETQLDFVAADVRAVSANIGGTSTEDVKKASADELASYEQLPFVEDLSKFTIPDHDLRWVDMDDFVELDWMLPSEPNPETQILPLAYAPRFTYLRQTDHDSKTKSDETRSSPFGDEPTHNCVMTQDNDPRRVQRDLVFERLQAIEKQIESHKRSVGEHELKLIKSIHEESRPVQDDYHLMLRQGQILQRKRDFIEAGYRRLCEDPTPPSEPQDHEEQTPRDSTDDDPIDSFEDPMMGKADEDGFYSSPKDELASDFNNRFVVHNAQLKWNNSLRNIILRYSHQVGQRRGFIYYMSRRAVKFIIDIVEEQSKSKHQSGEFESARPNSARSTPSSSNPGKDEDENVEDRIEQLLNDAKRVVDAEDEESLHDRRHAIDFSEDNIADNFTAQNSYHFRLIAPQIQLQSEKNTKSVLLVTAKGMQLKVVSIMDKDRVADDVSGLVQRRYSLDMEGAQFFVSSQKKMYKFVHLMAAKAYGNPTGSAWPPWVPMEVMFDYELNPFGFSRVIQKTSAALRCEKYNNLRLKYNEEVAGGGGDDADDGKPRPSERAENRMDNLWVEFPHVRAICDSSEYYSMYIIVLDLLMFSEPLEKVRSERLEKIMLASDFSDLRGAPEMVQSLQQRISQLEEIKDHFQINSKYLDRKGWMDRIALEKDIASCEDELFFIMKAITTSQRKVDDRSTSQTNGILRWYLSASEIVWHLIREKNEPLLEFQLRNAAYERIDNSDGSNHNAVEVEHIQGLNLLPNALYPDMIGPYVDPNRKNQDDNGKLLRVQWHMLEAIAGIPVLDEFEVNLFPLKVRLERELGKKLFEYIFPGVGSNAFENGGFSPFMIKHMQPLDENDDDSESEMIQSAFSSNTNGTTDSEGSRATSRPSSLELRLHPTLHLSSSSNGTKHSKPKPIHSSKESSRLLHPSDRPKSSSGAMTGRTGLGIKTKASADSIRDRFKLERTGTNGTTLSVSPNDEKTRGRFGKKDKNGDKDKDKGSDDLSQMLNRASNYMTLAHVKINDVVLCLSYKGKGERNIEDLHDFVFRLPVLEYRNKTWSNLDLALRLKKDVIRALISHTGAIIGNKLSHRAPSKQVANRLRDIAQSAQVLPGSGSTLNVPKPSSSIQSSVNSSQTGFRRSADDPRTSMTSGRGSSLLASSGPLGRTYSYSSSAHSGPRGTSINRSDSRSLRSFHNEDGHSQHSSHDEFIPRKNERTLTMNGMLSGWGRSGSGVNGADEEET